MYIKYISNSGHINAKIIIVRTIQINVDDFYEKKFTERNIFFIRF